MPSTIPFEWPAAWDAPTLARLLDGTPFTALLTDTPRSHPSDAPPLATPRWTAWAEIDWRSPPSPIAISNGFWPDLSQKGGDSEPAGPTGAPWLDANGWLLELIRARAPRGSKIWIRSNPPENVGSVELSHYALAYAEAAVYGAVRPVWLAPHHAEALARGESDAVAAWRSLCSLIRWFAARTDWASWITAARLAVVSDFAGPNEYISSETLLLLARRGLPFTPIATNAVSPAALQHKRAVLYLDRAPLPAPLLEFARKGGLLLALPEAAKSLGTQQPTGEPHPRFRLVALGKGRIALSTDDFSDPWLAAQDTHLLLSRRWDLLRLFNAGSLQSRLTVAPDRKRALVHLINYTRRPAAHVVSLSLAWPVRSVKIHLPPKPDSVPLQIHLEDGRQEVHLPPFPIYCAVEFELSSHVDA